MLRLRGGARGRGAEVLEGDGACGGYGSRVRVRDTGELRVVVGDFVRVRTLFAVEREQL